MAIAEKALKKKVETNNEGLRKNKITHEWFDSFMKQQPFSHYTKKMMQPMKEWIVPHQQHHGIIILTY